MDESALVAACIRGNYRAQKKLYQLYAPQMMGICMRYGSGVADAEDILQEAFMKVYMHLDSFSGKGPLGGWLRRITINTALQRCRRDRSMVLLRLEEADACALEVDDEALSAMSAKELMLKIQMLPAGYRTIFNLYAIEGYKHHEIAELLEISEGTSKSQYSRSRAMLREMIETEQRINERAI